MLRGALSVSAGSTIAVRQHSVVAQAHFPLLFRNVDHRILVTSAPVPAVVGIATNGRGLASN